MNSEIKLSQQEIIANADKISNLDLPEEDKALLLAGLYITNNYVEETIKVLSRLIDNKTQNKGVYRLLGDIYNCTKQYGLAQDCYKQVLNLSKNSPPCVEKVAAKAGLALIEAQSKVEKETNKLQRNIEDEFNTLASDRQVSALASAIRSLRSKDDQLADLITALTTDCPEAACSQIYKNRRVKSSSWALCILCIPA